MNTNESSIKMKQALLIINPSSGGEKAKEFKELAEKKLNSLFDELIVKETEKQGDAKQFAYEAAKQQLDINQTTDLDIGKINDSYFMNVVAIGTIPEVVNDVDGDDGDSLPVKLKILPQHLLVYRGTSEKE